MRINSRTISRTSTLRTSESSHRSAALLALLALGLSTGTEAQGFRLSGHVLHVAGSDTIALPGEWIVLHQVSAGGGGPVDSVRTRTDGTYLVSAARRDTGAVYIASVTFRDITYFTNPVRALELSSDTAETLFVFDTSSVAPEISVASRSIVVRLPDSDGSRATLELVVLENRGNLTRIAGDMSRPVWGQTLPRGAVGLEIGESDVSPDAITRIGDSIAVFAPLPPGPSAAKQLVFSYTLPAGGRADLEIEVDQAVDQLQVLLEDTTATLANGTADRLGVEFVDSRGFVRYLSTQLAAGDGVTFRFSRRLGPGDLWWVVILAVGLAFGAAVWRWRTVSPSLALAVDHPDVLAARIAALDTAFESRAAPPSEAERELYRTQRADLKTRLQAALARSSSE